MSVLASCCDHERDCDVLTFSASVHGVDMMSLDVVEMCGSLDDGLSMWSRDVCGRREVQRRGRRETFLYLPLT